MITGWRVSPGLQFFPGYALGCRYPSLVVTLEACRNQPDRRAELLRELQVFVPGISCAGLTEALSHDVPAVETDAASLRWLLLLCQQIQEGLGLAVFETGRVLSLSAVQARCQLPVAAQAQASMAECLEQILEWLGQGPHADTSRSATARLAGALQDLAGHALSGSNSARFVKAALELGVPVERLPGGVIQYGMGRRRRRLDSSFTDVTSNIAAKMARSKAVSNAMFVQAGLPVPRQVIVEDAQAAVVAAEQLGYPVVIKPADLDGGCGVAAGLTGAAAVRAAFEAARQLSAKVLLEQHVAGRDYRLTVFQGELLWAIERIPAHVTGDGRRSVAELIDQENADPRRGHGPGAALKRLVLDAEAQSLLAAQGLTAQSIVPEAQIVFLRQTANVATGGEPVAVFDKVHPDNARLAIRAAQQLGLDLAGIDLLIPDVSKSWRVAGNTPAICEINGQPNLGQITAPWIYGQILRRLLHRQGRIPSIVVLGAADCDLVLEEFRACLSQRGLRVATAGPTGVFLGDQPLTAGSVSSFRAGKVMLLDPEVDAAVIALSCTSWLSTGLPWSRFDTLVIAGTQLPAGPAASVTLRLEQWLRGLLPACDGWVFAAAGMPRIEPQSTAKWQRLDRIDRQSVHAIAAMTLALHDVGRR